MWQAGEGKARRAPPTHAHTSALTLVSCLPVVSMTVQPRSLPRHASAAIWMVSLSPQLGRLCSMCGKQLRARVGDGEKQGIETPILD